MKLTYQTGIATMIQFILLSLLTLVSQVFSVIGTCRQDDGNCFGNFITSVIFYLLVAIVFGSIWIVGLVAQHRRSKWLARLLICIEGLIALVALFSVKLSLHSKNLSGMLASLAIALLAVWIITLAFRLMRSEGKRITGRRRRHPAA